MKGLGVALIRINCKLNPNMERPNAFLLQPRIGALMARQPAGHCMLREFYSAEEVYRADCEAVWRSGWLFAGHSCEISKPGQYFTLEVDSDSVVVTRDESGQARAFHNVCRHRGSIVCDKSEGEVKKLVCPYHRWTYNLDGKLFHAPGMQEELDK